MQYHCHALHPDCIGDEEERVALSLFVHNMCENYGVLFLIELSNY